MAQYTEPYSITSIRNEILTSLEQKKNPILQQHIKKEFLWSVVAEKTLSVYKKVLNQ